MSRGVEIIDSCKFDAQDHNLEKVSLGDWFWIDDERKGRRKEDPIEIDDGSKKLCCVTKIGSNFIELETSTSRWNSTFRVHFNDYKKYLTHEPNAKEIIERNISHHKRRVSGQIEHISRISQDLGVPAEKFIESAEAKGSNSLAVINSSSDIDEFKKKLIKNHKEILPKLFSRVKKGNEIISNWMGAEGIMAKALISPYEQTLEKIENQIFNVSLYAGLAESTYLCRAGNPAGADEKICIMQRKLFMDEECLVDCDAGGMEFNKIQEFDKWLLRENNFERLLPFPKTIAVFQIRRNTKERHSHDISSAIVNMRLEMQDRFTFMYIRNGEQLHCIGIDGFEFDDKLFPDSGEFDFSEPFVARGSSSRSIDIMSEKRYEFLLEENEEIKKKSDAWIEENKSDENSWIRNPFWNKEHDLHNYKPYNKDNVYYDEITKSISDQINKFNRISLIIQGILDRSDALNPHPKVQLHNHDDFIKIIKPVYDATMCLSFGEAPDIKEYIKSCNEKADINSFFWGQYKEWNKKNREKYEHRPYYEPYGNDGPEEIMQPSYFAKRTGRVKFTWLRDRLSYDYWSEKKGKIKTGLDTNIEFLFNVSAYELGDYKKFFQDHRTRRKYLTWAPMLMAAEKFHSQNKGEKQ